MLINASIPPGESKPYSPCHVYTDIYGNDDFDNLTQLQWGGGELSAHESYRFGDREALLGTNKTRRPVTECSRYVYDTSTFKTTVVSQVRTVHTKTNKRMKTKQKPKEQQQLKETNDDNKNIREENPDKSKTKKYENKQRNKRTKIHTHRHTHAHTRTHTHTHTHSHDDKI